MLKNYLTIAFRNILRHRVSSIINILGLAAGISACLLIYMYVQREWSYDRHHEKADRIYRLVMSLNLGGNADRTARSSLIPGPLLTEDYPEVESYTRLHPIPKQTVWYENEPHGLMGVTFADSNLFEFFDYEFAYGNPEKALDEPYQIVITEETANRLLGGPEQAMGKVLKFAKNPYTVTGVLKENSNYSHLDEFTAFISLHSLDTGYQRVMNEDWFRLSAFTYLLFRDKESAENFAPKLAQFEEKRLMPWIKEVGINSTASFSMQPLEKVHFSNDLTFDLSSNTNPKYLYIFGIIALAILLIACINYMNIATARASARAREVGVRKVMGASRRQLFMQFIGESLLLTFFSLLLALVLTELLIPPFNSLTGGDFHLDFTANLSLWLGLLAILIFVGVVGGSYPALVLSSFKPVLVLKSGRMPRSGGQLLRKVLVIFQFAVSVVLVVGTFIVFKQIHYMKTKDMGFDKSNLLAMPMPLHDSSFVSHLKAFKEELGQHPAFGEIATADNLPGEGTGKLFFVIDSDGKPEERALNFIFADHNIDDVLGLKVEQGRFFNENFQTDYKAAFVINKAAARAMGWDKPLGHKMENGFGMEGPVVGVVEDFNYSSLHSPIEPLVLMVQHVGHQLVARIKPGMEQEAIAHMESTFREFAPYQLFEYRWVEQTFQEAYLKEERMLQVFGYFAILTVFIACLGLFGLASYATSQRTKEIGIRKVNGASVTDISLLFIKDFLKLVFIALIIAWPVSYLLMSRWLEDFAYRISLPVSSFLLAGLLAVVVALLTVSFHAVRAAWSDPVKALRYE